MPLCFLRNLDSAHTSQGHPFLDMSERSNFFDSVCVLLFIARPSRILFVHKRNTARSIGQFFLTVTNRQKAVWAANKLQSAACSTFSLSLSLSVCRYARVFFK